MAQIVIRGPDSDYRLPSSGDSVSERGVGFKEFVDDCNAMFNELYAQVGSGSQHVTLRGPTYSTFEPNTGTFSVERGDSFKTIIDQINAMFNEVYTLSGGTTAAKVTLRGTKSEYYLPNTGDFSTERGDSFKTIITQINAMFAECYANGAPHFSGSGDVKSGAYAYWSVARAYNAAYATGSNPAMDLVDQAGANQVTINVKSSGLVDVAAINTWVAANSVTTIKVKKLYDQTGNSRHVSQATLANMPKLLLTHPGFGNNAACPAMDFVASSNMTLVSGATGLSSSTGTFSFVARIDSVGVLLNGGFSGIVQAGASGFGPGWGSSYQIVMYAGSLPTFAALQDNFHACQAVFNGASSFVVVDGLASGALNPGAGTLGSPFTIGKLANANPLTGQISEMRFDSSAWSAGDCAAEYANQKAFWLSSQVYEGLVASRCRRRLTSDATNLFANSRSAHIAAQSLTSIKVGFRNPTGAAATITASIEYPAGTFTQLKFLGVTSITMTGEAFSDYASVSIPAGATFWVREFWNCNAGGGTEYNTFQNTFLGEATEMSATSISDKTMSGTITNSGSPLGVSRPPQIIVGLTSAPSVYIVGDSIASGTGDTEDTSNSATGYNGVVGFLARSVNAAGVVFGNWATSGSTAATQTPQLFMGKCSHLISEFGINDFVIEGVSSATLITRISNYTKFAGALTKVYQTTMLPYTNSTDAWATVVNQSVRDATVDTGRDAFNTALRNGTSGILRLTGFYDTASILESGLNSNKWIATPSPPYTGDGLHPNVAGHTLEVNSSIVPPPVWP